MADVFLSYASEDATFASSLARALEADGLSVWWDRRIPTGKSFDEVIEEELHAARCAIVLWSRNSTASTWVKNEATVAMERGVLYPAVIEEVRLPLAFRHLQAASLLGWQNGREHDGFALLLRDLKARLGATTTSKPKRESPPVVEPARRPEPVDPPKARAPLPKKVAESPALTAALAEEARQGAAVISATRALRELFAVRQEKKIHFGQVWLTILVLLIWSFLLRLVVPSSDDYGFWSPVFAFLLTSGWYIALVVTVCLAYVRSTWRAVVVAAISYGLVTLAGRWLLYMHLPNLTEWFWFPTQWLFVFLGALFLFLRRTERRWLAVVLASLATFVLVSGTQWLLYGRGYLEFMMRAGQVLTTCVAIVRLVLALAFVDWLISRRARASG